MVPRMAAVRPADAGEVPALSAALAQAFADEAVVNWLMPQRTRRVARRELMFMLELQTYVLPQDGMVFTAGGGSLVGGCLVLPPDRWQMPDAADGRTAVRWLRAFGVQLSRAIRTKRVLQEHHPSESHYYIRSVGVGPALQGQGLGSALMRPSSSAATVTACRRIWRPAARAARRCTSGSGSFTWACWSCPMEARRYGRCDGRLAAEPPLCGSRARESLAWANARECPLSNVRLDLAGADEFSVRCKSLPRTGP